MLLTKREVKNECQLSDSITSPTVFECPSAGGTLQNSNFSRLIRTQILQTLSVAHSLGVLALTDVFTGTVCESVASLLTVIDRAKETRSLSLRKVIFNGQKSDTVLFAVVLWLI